MAQKIIAQQIAMITFGTVMKILGIAASSGSSPFNGSPTLESGGFGGGGGGIFGNLSPGTDWMQTPGIGGVPGFAKGGMFTDSIVSSPTLFQFANGGTMETGVMGEAGSEAIMPLTRGPGGSLGVKAYLADSRAALGGGGSSTQDSAFADNRDALSATSTVSRERYVESVLTSGASSTEIKYSRVGSGDLPFVTEEDMLQATRVAAEEGAKRGQQRTLAALRNNPATRRSIGV